MDVREFYDRLRKEYYVGKFSSKLLTQEWGLRKERTSKFLYILHKQKFIKKDKKLRFHYRWAP